MYRRTLFLILNHVALFLLTSGLLITSVSSNAQSNDTQLTSSSIVSNQLLSNPTEYYQKLSADEESPKSLTESLQLALVQHLLGLNAELKTSLDHLKPKDVSEQPEWQILYFFLLGADALKDAEYEKAAKALEYAKTLSEKAVNKRLWVLSTQELAFNQALRERFEQAFLLLQEAYLLAQQFQGQFELALVEQTLGGVYSYTDNYQQANNYYQQALERYQALQFPTYTAETLLGIATTFRHQQNWSEALLAYEAYNQALSFQGDLGNAFFYHYGKGITLALSGRCVDAINEINAALNAGGPRDYLGELYKKKASCAAKNGAIEEATSALKQAQEILFTSPGLTDTLWQAELLSIESKIAEASLNITEALSLYKEFHETSTRLQARKSTERMLDLKSELESERKDAQITQLQQQSELQSLQLIAKTAQQQRSALVIGCAALTVIMLIGVIYYQRRKTQHLYALSVHDPLTNLFNRRHAIAIIEHWLEQHRSDKQLFSVLMIDVDQFKLINDNYGHSVGDTLLIEIATAMSKTIRPSDVLARFGGEEFICVLPRITPGEAEVLAERIRNTIAQTKIDVNTGESLSRSASIGIAHVSNIDLDLNTVLERADSAMYQAKAQGRDQVCVSHSEIRP